MLSTLYVGDLQQVVLNDKVIELDSASCKGMVRLTVLKNS